MGQRLALVPLAVILASLLAGCGLLVPAPESEIHGTVVNANSGEPIVGSRVHIEGHDTGFETTVRTDGRGQFRVHVEPDRYTLNVRKADYARSRVIGLDAHEPAKIEIVQRERFNPNWSAQPPEIRLSGVAEGDAFQGKIPFRVDAESPNDIQYIYVALDKTPGSSFLTDPRAIYAETSTTGEATLDPRLFSARGPTTFEVVVYDVNGNRTHLIRQIEVVPKPGKLTPPRSPDAVAVTLSNQIEFFGVGAQAAPPGSNIYTRIDWDHANARGVNGYRIYRSFDGQSFEPIGKIHAGRTAFRDESGELEVGKRVHYRVTALRGAAESAPSETVTVEPLAPFDVQLLEPTDGADNVARTPRFEWRPTKRVGQHRIYGVILWDTVLGNDGYWVTPDPSEFVVDRTAYRWNENGRFDGTPQQRLQPERLYEWEVAYAAAVDSLEDPSAVSFAANRFGLEHEAIPVQPIGVPASQNFSFSTGE